MDQNDKDLFNNITDIDMKPFAILNELFDENENILKNIVITGPYIRGNIVGISNDVGANIEIRKEIYVYRLCDSSWNELLDTTNFIDKKAEFVYDDNNIKICLVKKKYRSPAHVILQYGYLKRVGYYNDSYYVSSMFLIEMQKHSNLLMLDFKDPILGIPYDPLEIYQLHKKDQSHPIKIIEIVDYDELINLPKKNFIKLFNGKTCLEICLDRLVKEEHPIILNQLKQMILFLSSFKYKRPPYLYAKILKIDVSVPDLYELLKCIKNEYDMVDVVNTKLNTLDEINESIIEFIVSTDNLENLLNFLDFTKQKIGKNIVEHVVKYNPINIANHLVTNKLIDNFLIYYIILMTENLDLIKNLTTQFELDIATNYLENILSKGKIRSFYFLYESDPSIINTVFESGKNILHKINKSDKNRCDDLTHLIIKLKPELINVIDNNKENAVIYHAKNNPDLLRVFLDYNFDSTISDCDGNIFLHHLCRHDCSDLLKIVLKKYPELINMPNKKSETPAIICCQYGNENMFYTIKGMGADMKAKDYFGNTVYHYICAMSMCIGMMIDNSKNYFGSTPKDYCKISTKFYNFIDDTSS
jgi:hypothetical protein